MDPKIIRTWLSGPYIIQITKAFYKIHKDQEAVKIQECTQVSQIRTFSVSNTVRCHCLWGSISILLILLLTVGISIHLYRKGGCWCLFIAQDQLHKEQQCVNLVQCSHPHIQGGVEAELKPSYHHCAAFWDWKWWKPHWINFDITYEFY